MKFKERFMLALEDNTAGPGGVFGTYADSQFSGDSYAPGDTRVPKVLGTKGKKKKKMLIQRRADLNR